MHWMGGMGVLILTIALLPSLGGRTLHVMRAESPGPIVSKPFAILHRLPDYQDRGYEVQMHVLPDG